MASDDGLRTDARCHSCGRRLPEDAKYCPQCGTRSSGAPITVGAQPLYVITFAWLLAQLFLSSNPLTGGTGRTLFAYHLAFALPFVSLLVVAFLHARTHRATSPGPGAVLTIALAWLSLSLILDSDPSGSGWATVLWFSYSFGLAVLWCAFLLPDADRLWRVSVNGRLRRIAAILLPLPAAAVALIVLTNMYVHYEARLKLSEPSLNKHIEDFNAGRIAPPDQLVGLFSVESTYRAGDCVMLRLTGDRFDETGLAFCEDGRSPDWTGGGRGTRPLLVDHLYGDWWRYQTIES
jgi:hypothetical protein